VDAHLLGRFKAQPQRDVGGLHRLPHNTHQIIAQGVQASLVPKLGRECFESISGIVLTSVQATVYEGLEPFALGLDIRGSAEVTFRFPSFPLTKHATLI
jgi:hypothetical protein